MSTRRAVRLARSISDRAIRILLSVAMLSVYLQFDLAQPAKVIAAPAALSVTATVSAKPLLGGKATVHVTVKNTDTTDKAYNISVENTITSNNATAYATFVSATDANGALPPTANALNPPAGTLALSFINIRDLAPGESYSMDIHVDIGPSSAWKVGDLLQNTVRASGNTVPNQTIPDIVTTTNASTAVLPIIIKSKSTNQSTGVEQATGTTSRKYAYTVDVQNNYVGATQNVVVVDKLDDGIQFLGTAPASTWTTAPVVSQSPTSGVTTLTWNLGTMATSANEKIIYETGIRYDYYGSAHGGIQRLDASPLTSATAGAFIPDKTTLQNNVRLDATWQSNPASDTANSPVTAAYLTIAKGQTPSSGGSIDTTISYTLDYYNSQYYSILSTGGSILVHDRLPDGQVFATSTANPAPTSTQHNPDGSTDITWTVGAMAPTGHGVIKFDARVQQNWQDPALGGDPVVSGDTMTNTCDIRGVYQDQVRTARPQALSTSSASSGYSTSVPKIYKAMKDPEDPSGPWQSNIKMSIGDTSTVRVQFNTTDGINPERSNIDMGNIMLNDWLPAGMSIVPGSFNVSYSAASDFTLPASNPQTSTLNILTPSLLTVSGLQGAQWFIGNVKPAGWWQATFDVTVADVPAARDGIIVANLWKLTGYNTANTPYSDRAAAMTINYANPYLVLTKTASPPAPLSSGSQVPYTIAMTNTGTGRAHQVSITDTLPVGMRATAPVVNSVKIGASTLASGTDYLTSWEASTGTLAVRLNETAATAFGQSGSSLTVDYTATVDLGLGAGASLTNTATVSYSSAPNGNGHVTPGTNNVADDNTKAAMITLDPITVGKAGPASPLRIGGVGSYDVTFTVPAHDVAYFPSITDTINRQGFKYAGSATLTRISGPVSATASFGATSTPTQSYPTGASTSLTWTLANPIDNSAGATPATFRLRFDLQYTALAQNGITWEFAPPASTSTAVDTASLTWKVTPVVGPTRNATTNAVTTDMGQPVLAVTKAFNPLPAPLPVGGTTINYRVTIRNNGSQPAYNVSLDDTLPLEAASSALTSATLSGAGLVTSDITTSFALGPPPAMRFVLATTTPIPAGQTLTIDYKVTLSTNVAAGVALKNIADADWNSLPGAPAGARIYNDSPQEAYIGDLASITVNAQGVTINKIAPPGPYTIGDVITYSIECTVPANTVAYYPSLVDTVYLRGTQYEAGSARIINRNGTPSVPATLTGSGAPTSTVVGSNRLYTFWLNDTQPGHAIDNSNQATPYGFTLQFSIRVTGVVNATTWDFNPPAGSMSLRDDASLQWNSTNSATRPGALNVPAVTSTNKTTALRQPLLRLVKSVPSGAGPYAGNSFIDYRLVISNPGSSTAYDISMVDTLPVEVSSATILSATQSGVGSILSSVTASYLTTTQPHLQFDFTPDVSLPGAPATGTIIVDYRIQLLSTVGAGSVMANTADVNWASLSGPVTGRRVYNDSSQEGATWTQDSTIATVVVAPVTLTKRITSGLATATIGSIIPYTIEATIPLNTTAYGLTMTDTVPPGLSVVALSSSPLAPSPAVISTGPAGSVVVWNTGAAGVTNPTTGSAILTLWCQVRDTSMAGGPVPSGPISNAAQMSWRTQLGAGSVISTATPPVTFSVVQPRLSITKSASAVSASASDTVTFTSVITNASGAAFGPAYNVKWNDVLPGTMTDPVLLDVKHSGIPTTLTAGDYSTSVVGNTLNVSLDNTASAANEVAPGQTVTIRFTGAVKGGARNGTSMVDTATVSSYTSLPATSGARTYAPTSTMAAVNALAPALMASKTVIGGTGYPLAGETVHYQLKVWNVGTAAAHSVVVTDTLPGTQTYLAPSNATWPANSSSADPTISGAGRVLAWNWGNAVSLSTNETLTVDYWATVPSSEPTGTYYNTFVTGAIDAAGVPVFKPAALNGVLTDLNPTDSATATVRVVQPGILVTKTVEPGQDMFVQKGQAVGWRVTVTNTGDTTLTAVPLADTYDASVFTYVSNNFGLPTMAPGSLTWNLGSIGPGKKRSVDITFTAASVPPSNVGTNVATSAGGVDEFGHPLTTSADTATVGITRPQVSVNKVLTSDPIVQAGQPVTFDIGITNTGDQILASVPVTDTSTSAVLTFTGASLTPSSTVPAGTLHWNNGGPLLVGQTTTITVSYNASSAPVGNITTNTVTVSGIDVHADSAPSTSTAATVSVTRPHVMVTKSLAQTDTVVQQGQDVVYTLTVKNDGDTALSSFDLSDTWESGVLGYVSSSPAGSNAANTASWTIGPLAPNASTVVTLTLSALAVPAGQITTDTATVSGTDVNGDSAPGTTSSASVRVTRPAVSVTKALRAGQDPQVQVGENVVFDIVVKNTGDTTLTTVPLADAYDAASLTYMSAIPSANTSSSGNVNWTHVATLAPGAQTTVTATFLAIGVPVGQITTDTASVNNAVDQYGDKPANANAAASVRITAPAISIGKVLTSADHQIQVGGLATFDITVTNTGNTTLSSIVATDTWDPAVFDFDSSSPLVPGANGVATWAVPPLAPTNSYTFSVTLKALTAPVGLSANDTATVSAIDVYGDHAGPASNSAGVLITRPDLTVSKALNGLQDPVVRVGDNVTFDLTVQNSGNTTLTTIPLGDTYDAAALQFVSASVVPSSSVPGVLGWTNVGPLSPGTSTIINATFKTLAIPAGQVTTDTVASTGATDIYTDLTGPSSADASVRITNPAVGVTKALHAGQDPVVQAGDPVLFDIVVINTGDTTMATVPLTDTYDSARLAYVGALPSENASAAGSVQWNNLGTLTPGQSTTVTAAFVALSNPPGQVTTDTAVVSGATDIYTDVAADASASASIKVTAPSLTLTKTRTTDGAIQTSETVTFSLTVHNTGDTTLTTVPLTDTWDPGYLLFSASAPPTAAGLGFASWDVAPIAPGGSASVSLTLVALGPVPGLTTVDTATVVGAKDENLDDVNDAVASDSVDITKPAVSVNKVLHAGQDTHVQPGEAVLYDLVVKNTGDTTLTTVPLSDAYDALHLAYGGAAPSENTSSTGLLGWNNVGPLNVGQTTTVTVTFSALATGTSIPDTATITGAKDSNNDTAPPVADTNNVVRITAPGISITKAPVSGQDVAIHAGQTAAFDLVVTNTGDTTLTATTVSDTWDGAVFDYDSASMTPDTTTTASATFSLPMLAPGATYTVTLTLRALTSPVGLVSTDTVSVSATDEFGDHPLPDTATATQIVTRPAIGVVKSRAAAQDPVIQVGQTVTYDIVVTNTGDTTLTTVPLADTYDSAALEPLSATPPSTDLVNDGTLDWADLGQLIPNQTTTVTVTFEALSVPAGQVTTDTAATHDVVDYYTDDVADATSSADIRIIAPAVSITKAPVAGQDPVIQAGEPASFDIVVTNTGDTRLDTVPLDDTYQPAYLLYTGANRTEDSSTAATLHWDNVGPLNPSQSTTVTVHFSAITNPAGQVTTDTAAVTGATDQYGDHPADVSAVASIKITAPSLTLTKTLATGQDPQIQAGQVATFTLTVRNTGDTTLTTVPIADSWDSSYLLFHSSLPPATSGIGSASWDVAPIGPGESASVDLALMALQSVPGYTTTDTASVTGALDENNDSANDAIATAAVDITRPSVAVHKQLTAGQDPFVQVGDTVTYDIVVTNDGDIALASVPLSDAFDPAVFAAVGSTPPTSTSAAGSVGWSNVGPLLPGEITTVTVTMHAVGTSNGAASVDTATVADARDVNDDPAADVSSTAAATVTRPQVSVSKRLSAGQAPTIKLGDNVSYDLVVTNTGDTTITTLPLADTFQASQLAFVSAMPSVSTNAAGSVSWSNVASPAALSPGAVITVTVTFRALAAGNAIADLASIAGGIDIHDDSVPDTSSPNTVLSVFDPGALKVTKTADPVAGTIMLPGQTITYTLAWNNTGDVGIPNVVVSDPLPTSVTYVPGSLKLDASSQTDPLDADAGSFDPSTRSMLLDLNTVAAVSSGHATFQVTVAPEELSARGIANTAGFASAGSSIATAGPIYHPVDPFTITKVGKDLNGGTLKGGDVIEWTITVTNTGLTPTTNVKVTDTVPNTTTYVRNSIRGQGANDSASPNLVWSIGQMGVNEVQVLTFRSAVKKGLRSGTQIRNQATVSSDQSLPKRSDNPLTPTDGDFTILVAKTSGSEGWRYPLAAGVLLLISLAWIRPRRRLAELLARPRSSDLKGGGLGD